MAKDLELVIKLLKNEQKEAIKYRPLMKQEELRIIEEIENEKIGLYDDEFINNINHIILNAIPRSALFDQDIGFLHSGWNLLETIILEYRSKSIRDTNSFIWGNNAKIFHCYKRTALENMVNNYVEAEGETVRKFVDNLIRDLEAEKIIECMTMYGERGVKDIIYPEEIWIGTGESTAKEICLDFLEVEKINLHSYSHELGKRIITNFTYVLKIRGVL